MKKLFEILVGITFFLFFILLSVLFIKGSGWVLEKLRPYLDELSRFLFDFSVLVLILSIFKKLRYIAGNIFVVIGLILELDVFVVSFLNTIKGGAYFWIFFPTPIIGTFLYSLYRALIDYGPTGFVYYLLTIVIPFIMVSLGIWFITKCEKNYGHRI